MIKPHTKIAKKLEPNETKIKICSRCIYDSRVPSIKFDSSGVCNFCLQIDQLIEDYGTGSDRGVKKFEGIVKQIKKAGSRKKYDCVIGISGGTDSCFLIHLAKKWGLRPLAVHYDNTWNSSIATQNISKILCHLDVDLYTHVVNNKEADDIFRSFFYAGVPEIEAPTDLALAEVLYRAAAKYNVKYILEGHSFVTEGITPIGKNYFDGRYIREIHKAFGRVEMSSYPLMTLSRFLKWILFYRIRKIRPFWYLDYSKEEARLLLKSCYGWQYYGGHHLENRMTAFFHTVYAPKKFNADYRNNALSALVRNKVLTRQQALDEYDAGPVFDKEVVSYFKKRLGLTDPEYDAVMNAKPKYWTDYPTYKRYFELLSPMFMILTKVNLVPMSFYLKYCSRSEVEP